jgi:peptidoglycan/LPS O-acetylase OafA/YrhL
MLWPVALLGLRYLPKRFLLPVLGSGFALATLWRCTGLYLYGWDVAYFRFDFRLSGLLLGAALSVFAGAGRTIPGVSRFALYASRSAPSLSARAIWKQCWCSVPLRKWPRR